VKRGVFVCPEERKVKVLRIICGDKEEEGDARRTKKLHN
jgi:hypothetical protein